MPAITSRLMGYNKKQVDKHLEAVRRFQDNEICLIMENIDVYRKEREQLTLELNKLQNEMTNRVKPRDFLEYSLERAKNYTALVEDAIIGDIQDISRSLKQRVATYGNYTGEVENEIAKTTTQMDSVFQGILSLTKEKGTVKGREEAAAQKVVGTILPYVSKFESIITALGSTHISVNEDITGRTVVSLNGAFIGLVGSLVINESTSNIEGFYLKEEHSGVGSFLCADCVIAVKKDSLVVSAEWQKMSIQAGKNDLEGKTAAENLNIVDDRITADGITPSVVTSIGPADGTKDIAQNISSSLEVVQETSGNFWELHEQNVEAGYSNFELHKEEEVKEKVTTESFFSTSEMASAAEVPFVSETVEVPLIQESAGSPGSVEEPVQSLEKAKKVQSSPAVEKEIKTIQHKYVVGKLAGEDLLDSGGKIIILKNELITTEVVEKAEMEGKLPELIINMVIPGLEN